MLLSRSLPPHFLLPAWSTRQLLRAIRRAHSSTTRIMHHPSKRLLETQRNADTKATRQHATRNSTSPSQEAELLRQDLEMKRSRPATMQRGPHISKDGMRASRPGGDEGKIPAPTAKKSEASDLFDQRSVVRLYPSHKGYVQPKRLESMREARNQSPNGSADLNVSEPTTWGFSSYSMGKEQDAAGSIRDMRGNGVGYNGRVEQRVSNRSLLEDLDDDDEQAWNTRSIAHKSSAFNKPRLDAKQPRSTRIVRCESQDHTKSLDEATHSGTGAVHLETADSVRPGAVSCITPLSENVSDPKTIPESQAIRKKITGSLFTQLFPEEDEVIKQSEEKPVQKLPAFEWHGAPEIDCGESAGIAATSHEKDWIDTTSPCARSSSSTGVQTTARQELRQGTSNLGVLVLKCASKTLEESDFFRLGSKGQHIAGWTSGILRVIQDRDSLTLEPLGTYYLVFSSEAAAAAYLDNTLRLHRLSRTHGSGTSPLPLPPRLLHPGEDIRHVLRGYSLAPGQTRLSLKLLNRPLSPKVSRILSDGGPAAVARHKMGSENMVLFSADGGRIPHFDLRHAIDDDGRRRNLPWRLRGGGEKAIVRINGAAPRNVDEHSVVDPVSRGRQEKEKEKGSGRGSARFILSFEDPHEARRFVREWHRRPFPMRREYRVGDESPPMMNVEMFR